MNVEQSENIKALVSLRNKTGAEITKVYEAKDNGTSVIRIDFAVKRPMSDLDIIKVRAALSGDALVPAAMAMGIRLQCGSIKFKAAA